MTDIIIMMANTYHNRHSHETSKGKIHTNHRKTIARHRSIDIDLCRVHGMYR